MSTASAIHGSRLADIAGRRTSITDPAHSPPIQSIKKPPAQRRALNPPGNVDVVKFAVKEKNGPSLQLALAQNWEWDAAAPVRYRGST